MPRAGITHLVDVSEREINRDEIIADAEIIVVTRAIVVIPPFSQLGAALSRADEGEKNLPSGSRETSVVEPSGRVASERVGGLFSELIQKGESAERRSGRGSKREKERVVGYNLDGVSIIFCPCIRARNVSADFLPLISYNQGLLCWPSAVQRGAAALDCFLREETSGRRDEKAAAEARREM